MQTPKRSVFALLLATLASLGHGCAGHKAIPPNDPIREIVERFVESVNRADTDAFVAFFAAEATAFFPTNAARRTGVQQIRDAVSPVFAQGPRAIPARADDLQIARQGDMAIATFDAGNGSQHARRTLVLQRKDGQWKIVHLHASNVSDPG